MKGNIFKNNHRKSNILHQIDVHANLNEVEILTNLLNRVK